MADLCPQDESLLGTYAPGQIQSLLVGLGKVPPFNRGWLRYKLSGTILGMGARVVDIDGFEDKALVPFFTTASDALLPRRIVIEHLMMDGGRDTCLGAMDSRGYVLVGKTHSNSLYELKSDESASGE